MNCVHVQEHLEQYIRGELEPKFSSEIKQHIAQCDRCKKELDDIESMVKNLLRLRKSLKVKEDLMIMKRKEIIKKASVERRNIRRLLPSVAAAVFLVMFLGISFVMQFPSLAEKYTPDLPVIKELAQARAENNSVKQEVVEVKKENEQIKEEINQLKIKLKQINGTQINEVQTSSGISEEENDAIQSLVLDFIKAQYRKDLDAVKNMCTEEFKKQVDKDAGSILWRKNGEVIFSTITNVAKTDDVYLVFVRLNETSSEGEADYQEDFELVKADGKFLVSFVGNDA